MSRRRGGILGYASGGNVPNSSFGTETRTVSTPSPSSQSSPSPNGDGSQQVVVVSQHFHPEDDATGALMTSLATGLASRGFTVSALAAQPSYFADSKVGSKRTIFRRVSIERVWSTRFGRHRIAGRLVDAVSLTLTLAFRIVSLPRKATVIVVTNPPFLPIAAALSRLIGRGRLVIVIHDVFPDTGARLGLIRPNGLIYRLLTWLMRATLSQADRIIVLGRDMEWVIRERLPYRCRGRVNFVPNWADGDEIYPMPKSESRVAQAEHLDETFTVQYSGNIGRTQDLEGILDAAEILQGSDITFSFVGEGANLRRLMEMAERRSLKNVRFRPRVERSELADSLAACDVALVSLAPGMKGLSVPSKYYAALASGRAVVAVMAPGAEIAMSVTENTCGVVVPPGDAKALADAIQKLRDDPVGLAIRSFNARQSFEAKYNVDRAIDRYAAIVESAVALHPPSRWRPAAWDVALVPVAVMAVAVVGYAYGVRGWALLLGALFVAASATLMISSRAFRAALVLIGGLAVFWSSSELDLPKVVYMSCLIVAIGVAVRRLARENWPKSYRVLTPLLLASLAFLLLVLLSMVVSISMGTPITRWFRDAAPYLLFASVPFLVYDWQRVASARTLAIFLAIAGIASSASLALLILTRRDTLTLPLNHFLLPSAMLAAAAICYAAARAVQDPRARIAGVAACSAIAGLLVLSGTRTFLVLAIPVVTVLIISSGRLPGWRVIGGGIALLAVATVAVHFVAQWIGGGAEIVVSRFEAIPNVLLQPSHDLSYQERAQETAGAWQLFLAHPLLGSGPGHLFTWKTWTGVFTSSFNIDTGLSLLAKFGIAGGLGVAAIGIALALMLRRLPEAPDSTTVKAALIGYATATVVMMPFAAPLEDKGFVIGWAFLLTLATRLPRVQRVPVKDLQTIATEHLARAVQHQRRTVPGRTLRRRLAAAAVVLAILSSIGGGTVFAYQSIKSQATQLESRLTQHIQLGQKELEVAKASLKQANQSHDETFVNEAKVHFVNAKLHFLTASQIADSSELLGRIENLPSVGPLVISKHSALDDLSTMGVHLAQAGLELADLDALLIKPPGSGQQGQILLTTINQLQPKIEPVRAELSVALAAADAIDVSVLPSGQKATFLRARGTIGQALAAIDQFKGLVPILIEILGGNGARTYLIEQLNPAELRPGGGFIGTFSLLRADHGVLTVKSGDVQEFIAARGSLGDSNYVEPPGPFREWLPYNGWSFIDSNFFADFPTNAKKGIEFAQPRLGHIDGVIAIDYWTVARLLGVTGPIAVSKFNVTLTEANFVATVVKAGLDTLIDPSLYEFHKAILFATAGPLFEKIIKLQPAQWSLLTNVLNELATSHHIQVYFNDPAVEKTMIDFGWAGNMKNPWPDVKNSQIRDYVMEVEANLGGTKANYYVTRHFKLELTHDRTNLHHTLQVNVTDNMPYVPYRGYDYYSVYARLLITADRTAQSSNLLHGPPGFIGRTLYGPPPPQGLEQIEGWLYTRGYGNGMTLEFNWDTPWKPNGRGEEQIYWQKQPGTINDQVDVIWNDGFGNRYQIKGDLAQDRIITVATRRGVTLTQGQIGTLQLPSLSLG